MRLSLHSVKLTSLFAVAACLGLAASGCFFVHDDDDHRGNDSPPDATPAPVLETQLVAIDADATLEASPGKGVGVFVEYATGGHWNVLTTCDSNTPVNQGIPCGFDIFATVLDGGSIDNPKGRELAGKDGIEIQADGTVHLYTENTLSLSGISFDTAPGATVELEVYLDGVADPHFIYWVGREILHRGAPSNPIDFQPSEAVPTDSDIK